MWQLRALFALTIALLASCQTCPPPGFDALANVDLESYISAPWYVQQQMPLVYQQRNSLYCVRAEYEPLHPDDILDGVLVKNYANEGRVNGPAMGTSGSGSSASFPQITAIIPDRSQPSKLRVGFGFGGLRLPDNDFFKGDYWIVAAGNDKNIAAGAEGFPGYDWAIISGGPPTTRSNGACRTGSRVSLFARFQTNNIGLWLFSRKPVDPANTAKMRSVASSLGFDLSVLVDVVQEGCTYEGAR